MTGIRPAVRVLCIDDHSRVLLMHWRDPSTGAHVWEPPGGGIEAGESTFAAARRELIEETGLSNATVYDANVMVHRDAWWNGEHYLGEETFFLARVSGDTSLTRDGLELYEFDWLVGHGWLRPDEITQLADPVEPPELLAVLAQLDPSGGWVDTGVSHQEDER